MLRRMKTKHKPKLLKTDVVAAFGGVERHVALALEISAQAVDQWGKWVPQNRVFELLAMKPELKASVRHRRA